MEIETEINLYRNRIRAMTDQELLEEFKALEIKRKTGKEKDGELQINFNLIRIEERERNINLHAMKLENVKPVLPVEMIEVKSKSLHSYGYNALLQMFYVRFRSSETIYPFAGITPETFNDFLNASSKGSFVAEIIKKGRSNEKNKVKGKVMVKKGIEKRA